MGYTHKWYRPPILPCDQWSRFVGDWMKVAVELMCHGPALAGPGGVLGDPLVMDHRLVAFNGAGDARFEDFYFARRFELPDRVRDGRCFSFCKTAKLPYDLAVTACLLVAKRHFGDALSVFSDGEDDDWQAAREICQSVLGYGQDFHIRRDDAGRDYALVEGRTHLG